MGKSAVGSRGRPRAGRRPARGRPPNGSRPEACLEKVGWYGRPEAGLWKADFCKFALKISTFVGKLEIWKLCFFMRMDLSSLAWEKHKKIPPTPTPQLNFVARCQNAAQLFFSLRIIAPGAGGFFMFFSCEAGRNQRQFYVFAKCIFHEKICYKTFLCHFLSKFMFLKNHDFFS